MYPVTNFFQTLASIPVEGDWTICLRKKENGQFVGLVKLENQRVGDDAKNIVMPLTFKGTADEIDQQFFEKLHAPAVKTSQLFVNMEAHLKSVEEAKKQSKMEQDKAAKEKTEKDKQKREAAEVKKKYEEQMKVVGQLLQEQKYEEALQRLPDPTDFADFAKEIGDKLSELKQKLMTPALF